MAIKIAPLHAEHCRVGAELTAAPEHSAAADELYLAVSEKPGDDNNGYLVADLDDAWWCACGDFAYRCVDEAGTLAGECKHIEAVKLRTGRDVEDDQATLLDGA